jgi:drug/metabolite transporter (DMT)-like permease
MFNATAAGLEKREGMRAPATHRGLRLLATLARRPLWVLAMALSALAWLAEAAALALAPVPTVATLRNAGRGLLVLGGGRWLEERFSRLELAGVALASAGGALTAVAGAGSGVARVPLSNLDVLAVGAGCALAAAVVGRLGAVLGRPRTSAGRDEGEGGRDKAGGVLMGVAVGLLYAGTGVFTKELADRVADYGAGAIGPIAASPALWTMLAFSVWAQSLLQEGFRRANAATVSAANASMASLGLIVAGLALYGGHTPHGGALAAMVAGMVVSVVGTALLVGFRPARQPAVPEPAARA